MYLEGAGIAKKETCFISALLPVYLPRCYLEALLRRKGRGCLERLEWSRLINVEAIRLWQEIQKGKSRRLYSAKCSKITTVFAHKTSRPRTLLLKPKLQTIRIGWLTLLQLIGVPSTHTLRMAVSFVPYWGTTQASPPQASGQLCGSFDACTRWGYSL